MKIALVFLLVALSSCYEPSAASCMSRCAKSCGQYNMADFYCLKQGLIRNVPGTVSALGNFLCTYDRCKAMKDKSELIGAINNLKAVTGCPLLNVLGNDFTHDELMADVDGILQHLLRAAVDLLGSLNIGTVNTVCGPLKPLTMKINQFLHLIGVSRLDGQAQALTGINGQKALLKAVAKTCPGVLPGILQLLLGKKGPVFGLLQTLFGPSGIVNGLTGTVSHTLQGLTSSVGGSSGGHLGSLTGLLGNKGPQGGGLLSFIPELVEGLAGTAGGVTSSVTDTLGGMTSGLGVGDMLSVATGGQGGLPNNLVGAMTGAGALPSVLDPMTGLPGGSNGAVGEGNRMLSGAASGFGGAGGETGDTGFTAGSAQGGIFAGAKNTNLFSGAFKK